MLRACLISRDKGTTQSHVHVRYTGLQQGSKEAEHLCYYAVHVHEMSSMDLHMTLIGILVCKYKYINLFSSEIK